jgi:hypothetical protein
MGYGDKVRFNLEAVREKRGGDKGWRLLTNIQAHESLPPPLESAQGTSRHNRSFRYICYVWARERERGITGEKWWCRLS